MLTGVREARGVSLAAALLLLNVSLTFENVWPTPMIRWQGALSVELAACAGLFAIIARTRRVPPGVLRVLAAVWTFLILGRYGDVTAPALYGREVNLFWDVRHLSAVSAMLVYSASSPLVLATIAAAIAALLGLYAGAAWSLARLADAAAEPRFRRAMAAVSAAAIGLFALQRLSASEWAVPRFAAPVSLAYAHQGRVLFQQIATRHTPTIDSRTFTESDLARVRGADVYLVFVESYGAVTYDRPDFAAQLAAARAGFAADVSATGRQVVSAFVDSPTFGGSSWLAHVSLMTGVETRDEDTNVVLMAQQRDTLVTTFARSGYRTIALMPGLQSEWPEGAFYNFDRIYGETHFAYRGPDFGWWTVPDQYALARLDPLEGSPGAGGRAPRFVFFPTTSTHAPFTPTAPYQPDWKRVLTADPYDEPDVLRAWDLVPDYLDLAPGYVRAVSYAYASIGGYLRNQADRDLVMVMIGDHQPAAAVAGEGATWEVPVHVIASRPELLDVLRKHGFQDGLTPHRPRLGKMHALLPTLLDAFGNRSGETQARSAPAAAAQH
jgi:hypothetical protein